MHRGELYIGHSLYSFLNYNCFIIYTLVRPDEKVGNQGNSFLAATNCEEKQITQFNRRPRVHCSNGNYKVHVSWKKPWTYRPLVEYRLRWGYFFALIPNFEFLNANVIGNGKSVGIFSKIDLNCKRIVFWVSFTLVSY